MSIQPPSARGSHVVDQSQLSTNPQQQNENITLSEIGPKDGIITFQLDTTMRNSSPMQNILDITKKYNFSPDQIANVHVSTSDSFDEKTQELPINETTDTWVKNGKAYAKIPMHYEIECNDGQRKLKIQFNQDYKANVEIPIGGTNRQIAQFNQKIAAIAFGIRTEIQAPILAKDSTNITRIAKDNLPHFTFRYGDQNHLNGKKITWNTREKLDTTNEQREIIGVEYDKEKIIGNIKYKGNFFNKIFQMWYTPYSTLSDDQHEMLIGSPFLKYDDEGMLKRRCNQAPKYPCLEESEKHRRECASKSRKTLSDLDSDVNAMKSSLQEFTSILQQTQSASHRIDPETLVHQEAKAAQEDILDINDLLKRELNFTKDSNGQNTPVVQESATCNHLRHQYTRLVKTQNYIEENKLAYKEKIKELSELIGKDEEGNSILPADLPIDKGNYYKLLSLYHQFKDMKDQMSFAFFIPFGLSEIKENVKKVEHTFELLSQTLEYARQTLNFPIDKKNYLRDRTTFLDEIKRSEDLLDTVEGRIATITVLTSPPSSLAISKNTKQSIANLEKLKKEKEYQLLKDKLDELNKIFVEIAPAIPSDNNDTTPITLSDV